jgi:pimeloyl-ACP methyl ester carboxylesterase
MAQPPESRSHAETAIEFAKQAEKLGQYTAKQEDAANTSATQAIEAKFVTAQDPVIQTAGGGRLPAVPLEEALKLNNLKDELEGRDPDEREPIKYGAREAKDGSLHGAWPPHDKSHKQSTATDAPLGQAIPPAKTNPLFPPMAIYGPPSMMRNAHSLAFRMSSAVLSLCFLMVIILGAFFTSIPLAYKNVITRLKFQDPDRSRIFYEEEKRRSELRREAELKWASSKYEWDRKPGHTPAKDLERDSTPETPGRRSAEEEFKPTEGGPDPMVCDVGYYARRVGLDCEVFDVQTEDGFILELWHLYNPLVEAPREPAERGILSPDVFTSSSGRGTHPSSKYPVLLIHGLLQSAGAYCCTDENSLAFYLAKSGLDVWLGNNRCGFKPRHTLLKRRDPRMWAWNIRQMGVMDLPALVSRVLYETGFEKLALVAHSQGTTETLVALAREQRPDLGDRLSLVCLLAPAAYAGPLIGKMYFKFMRIISPGAFRAMFGIHAFIPFMMSMHRLLPGKFYGFMGYRVFSFLFNWTDSRWERGLRDRCFQFAPVYVSAESMRWWLGRECFATQKCILATREEGKIEDREDEEEQDQKDESEIQHTHADRERYAWYDERVPPFALWVCGSDDLVDGPRLLRRFERGREPFVEVVHSKIIPEYEHLDVLWAVDSIDQVGKEVLETIWKTVPDSYRTRWKVPRGCESLEPWRSKRPA